MFFRIVAIVMWAAPIGAFGAIAFTVGKFGAGSLVSLGKLLISFYITCLIFILAVLWPIAHLCGVSLFRFIRYIREELVDRDRDHVVGNRAAAHDRQARSGRLRGERGRACHSDRLFVQSRRHLSLSRDRGGVFGAGDQHAACRSTHQLELLAVLLLASKGAAGVAGAAFIVLAATLGAVGTIPVESVAIILGVHRLMSQALTPTNLIGNGVATLVIARWERALDETPAAGGARWRECEIEGLMHRQTTGAVSGDGRARA